MLRKQQGLADLSLDELAERAGDASPGAPLAHAFEMEFMKRQTECHQEAAKASKETANATKQYAKYMLLSIIILALSSAATLILQLRT